MTATPMKKIIGVPTDKVDPIYSATRDRVDLPVIEPDRIGAFFRVDKDLPLGRNPVRLDGYDDAAQARELIRASMQRFNVERALNVRVVHAVRGRRDEVIRPRRPGWHAGLRAAHDRPCRPAGPVRPRPWRIAE